ncbi:hypothetical protein SDRG_06012 [Saprolegnia diclina VS20]|uniref:Uncharacterized protein n=1 Tax=Saprolegnia diclina (strain VS20) TaxID=1156394 RepID=T0QPA7_SAPDV|nr:hypothetical protein SDRG_06012 [Saprolegnia diclina VS20]EQC36566.1 hypothetical protein SDRG_06012 [Saprolegnia diclina VS20]|eukprot:XP_008609987.1 hypothetical protein SDRG_06012 [Saprolegnia diclina VS20]
MYPLHSTNDAVVEHALLTLWKIASNPSHLNAEHCTLDTIPIGVWSSVGAVLLHINPRIRTASAAVLKSACTSAPRVAHQLVHKSDVVPQLCQHLISTLPGTTAAELTLVVQALLALTTLDASMLCSYGAIDAASFVLLHPSYAALDYAPAQVVALRILSSLVYAYPPAFEDMETKRLFPHLCRQLVRLDDAPTYVAATVDLFLVVVASQPLVLCDLHELLPWTIMQLQKPQHQLAALQLLRACVCHVVPPPHLSVAGATQTALRSSGALIDVVWLAVCHTNAAVVAAAVQLWTSLQHMSDEGFIIDTIEQGCVGILLAHHPRLGRKLLPAVSETVLAHLIKTLVVSTNGLLHRNILVALLTLVAHDPRKRSTWLDDDFTLMLQTTLRTSTKASPHLLHDLLAAVHHLCESCSPPECGKLTEDCAAPVAMAIHAFTQRKVLPKVHDLSVAQAVELADVAHVLDLEPLVACVIGAYGPRVLSELLPMALSVGAPAVAVACIDRLVGIANSSPAHWDAATDSVALVLHSILLLDSQQ